MFWGPRRPTLCDNDYFFLKEELFLNSPNSFEVHNGPTEMKLAAMRCLSEKLLEAASPAAPPPCVNITCAHLTQ